MHIFITIKLFLGILLFCSASEFDYYWRDYNGIIPPDAIPGGYDINHKTTYIGQVIYDNIGLVPATINCGEKSVTVCRLGKVLVAHHNIKILCSQNVTRFEWVEVLDATSKHNLAFNRHLVVGGFEDKSALNVARINYQGEVKVGKLLTYSQTDAKLFFSDRLNNQEKIATSYQVLTYKTCPFL